MDNHVAEPRNLFVEAFGTDGCLYSITPLAWDLAKVQSYYERFQKYKIFSDDVMPRNLKEFERFVLLSSGLWFEMNDEHKGETIGLLYLMDFAQSPNTGEFLSASFHMSVWDAKVSTRLPVLRQFVRAIFAQFKLHRLEMEIPLFAGGAIRLAKKSGFTEEGVRRKARRYDGVWFGVLHLSMLDSEVP